MSTQADTTSELTYFSGINDQYSQMFEGAINLGGPDTEATAHYDVGEQAYFVGVQALKQGAGEQLHYLYRKIKGDFIVTTQVELVGRPGSNDRYLGWMLRNSLKEDACSLAVGTTDKETTTPTDLNTKATQEKTVAPSSSNVIQLERRGQRLIFSHAAFGEPFTHTELDDAELADELYVGIFLRSNDRRETQAVFHNVRIVVPAWPSLVPYRDFLGSHLELLTLATGERELVYSTSEGIEAPNWTPDNNSLIYNSGGRLYRFDFASGKPQIIDTDFAIKNNNDHVLSFDGSMIGISHHAEEYEGKSIIYKLPVTGGKPQQLVSAGPSYLHGWSPDGKHIIYTAERQGQYDIYRTTTDGKGEETQLTDNPGLDDGAEYSPDGKTIYFNSVRGERMQLWQMNADGSDQRPITHDDFNNWFPHVSPDGKTLVFLSYRSDVAAGEHPYYQQVYLRSMPITGGKPKIVAYLYGGQGTINVPSWSPDGKRLAFVSNSVMTTK